MASKTCPSCNGSGYNAMRGVIPGGQKNAPICSNCGGKGWVFDNSSSYSTGRPGGCFIGETKIKVPGGWRKIQDLNPGDWVVSLNISGELVNRRIIRTKVLENRKVQTIVTSAGFINVTPHHSIQLSNKKWKQAFQLKRGDSISFIDIKNDPQKQTIIQIDKNHSATVYNIVVERNYTFIAEGCVAHSFSYFKKFKGWYYSILVKIREMKKAAKCSVVDIVYP